MVFKCRPKASKKNMKFDKITICSSLLGYRNSQCLACVSDASPLAQAQRQHAAGWAAVDQGKIRAQEAGRGVQQKAAELAQNVILMMTFMKSKRLSADVKRSFREYGMHLKSP